ncbi:MAG: DUF2029 domain-containing protein [Anaerolineaceae bacterium]|jgi:hypothetical protein|nr:MAG: DUF2029 domain-containing protein [Anaerolineaceae bacterium]
MLKNFREKDIKLSPQAVDGYHLLASAVILGIFAFFIGLVYWNLLPPRKDLYNELWGPAYLLVNGKSPYDTTPLNSNLPAAWLPMSIGFFAPIGWLDERAALLFWFVFNLVEICLVVLIAQGEYKPAYLAFITALFAFAFPPAIYHLMLGQFSLTTTLCAIIAARLIAREKHWLGAFFLALALSKPHLMSVMMLGLSAWYFRRGGAKSMLGFWLKIAFAAMLLCLPLFIGYPNWIPDALASMTSNEPWAFPTLLKLFTLNFGGWGIAPWGGIVVGIVAAAIFLWKRFDVIASTYWSLGLALLISPYLGSWDFVTLLPIIVFAFMKSGWKGRLVIVFSYLLAWYGMAFIQALEESHNHYFWWIPVWFMAVAAVAARWMPAPPKHDVPQFTG